MYANFVVFVTVYLVEYAWWSWVKSLYCSLGIMKHIDIRTATTHTITPPPERVLTNPRISARHYILQTLTSNHVKWSNVICLEHNQFTIDSQNSFTRTHSKMFYCRRILRVVINLSKKLFTIQTYCFDRKQKYLYI